LLNRWENGNVRALYLILNIAIAACAFHPATAADVPIPPPEHTAPAKENLVHTNQAKCLRWTDECVSCTRGESNEPPLCSNIGVTCQPKAIRCVEPETPPPPASDDSKPKTPQ
jgi:hypothetical protein